MLNGLIQCRFAAAGGYAVFTTLLAGTCAVRAGELGGEIKSAATPSEGPQFEFRISTGVAWQSLGEVRIRAGSRSSGFSLPSPSWLTAADPNSFASAGPERAFGIRQYDDGFVKLAPFTGAPGAVDPQGTWNWGYQNKSQVSPNRITFHLNGTVLGDPAMTSSSRDLAWSQDNEDTGPHLQFDLLAPIAKRLRVGPQFIFDYGHLDTASSGSNFSLFEQRSTLNAVLTDTYNLHGIIPPLPPYKGNFAGPGPVIDNIPAKRTIDPVPSGRAVSTQTAQFSNEISEVFKADVFTLALGVNAEVDLTSRLFAFGGGGVAVRIADYEATNRESLFFSENGHRDHRLRTWNDRRSRTEALWGGYVQGGLGIRLAAHWSLSGFVRYQWSEALSANTGPARFVYHGDGITAGGMISFIF